jgi:uncharacterized protein (TIGR00297 family)
LTDPVAFALFAAVLLGAVGVGEALRAWAGWAPEASRRVVHVGVGLATALCPPLFASPAWIYALAAVFVVANAVAIRRRYLPAMHAVARPTWGTAVFPLALIVALWACWTLDASRVFVLQTAFVVLALADPAASLAGARARRGRFVVGDQTKSLAGSAAFAATAGLATAGSLWGWAPPSWTAPTVAVAALTVALVGAAAEALGRRGWDNLAVVLAVVVPLVAMHEAPSEAGRFAVALGVAVVFGAAVWRAGALDVSGALAGAVFAWMLVALGGTAWAAPALAFFVLSSALSRLPRRADGAPREREARDASQVLANGGVAALCLALWAVRPPGASARWDAVGLAAFAGSLAAAAADTWATEIGTRWGGVPRRLAVGRRVAPGESGGVTFLGTLAAVAGAGSVALAASLASPLSTWAAVVVVGAGLVGATVDTLLGATLQARFRRPDGRLAETDGGGAWPLARGVRGLTNGAVNLACTLAGALAAAWVAFGSS